MMRCAPLISIVAQSVSIELILPPEASISQPRSAARSAHAAMYELPVRPTVLRPAPLDLPRVPCSLGGRSDTGEGHGHGRLWRGSFPTSPAAFQGAGHRAFASPIGACRSAAAWWAFF